MSRATPILAGPATAATAHAGVIQDAESKPAALGTAWTSDTAAALEKYLPPREATLAEDAKAGRRTVEVMPDKQRIVGVRVNGKGEVVERTLLVDLAAAAPEAFKAGSGVHVIATAKRARATSSSSILTGEDGPDPLFLLDITVYAASGPDAKVIDEVSLAFNIANFLPSVSPAALEKWAYYWNAANTGSGWYSPYYAEK